MVSDETRRTPRYKIWLRSSSPAAICVLDSTKTEGRRAKKIARADSAVIRRARPRGQPSKHQYSTYTTRSSPPQLFKNIIYPLGALCALLGGGLLHVEPEGALGEDPSN